jgi:hypothetical protein
MKVDMAVRELLPLMYLASSPWHLLRSCRGAIYVAALVLLGKSQRLH